MLLTISMGDRGSRTSPERAAALHGDGYLDGLDGRLPSGRMHAPKHGPQLDTANRMPRRSRRIQPNLLAPFGKLAPTRQLGPRLVRPPGVLLAPVWNATLRARVDAIRARSTPMTSTRSSAASERARARQRHRRHGLRRRARQHERHARRRRASRAARRVSATSQRSRRSHSRRHAPVAVRLLPRTSSSEDIVQREQRRSHARRWAGRAEGHALGRRGSRPAHSPRSPPPVSPARRPCSNSAER